MDHLVLIEVIDPHDLVVDLPQKRGQSLEVLLIGRRQQINVFGGTWMAMGTNGEPANEDELNLGLRQGNQQPAGVEL